MDKKSVGFNLFVDEEMCKTLIQIINIVGEQLRKGNKLFDDGEAVRDFGPRFIEFIKKVSDLQHKANMCFDPDCERIQP